MRAEAGGGSSVSYSLQAFLGFAAGICRLLNQSSFSTFFCQGILLWGLRILGF